MEKKTIQEQHLQVLKERDFISINSDHRTAVKCSQITEDIAIQFANWIWDEVHYFDSDGVYRRGIYRDKTDKELFELFKQEQQL